MDICGLSWREMRLLRQLCEGHQFVCCHGHFKFVNEPFERSSHPAEILLKLDLARMWRTSDVCTEMVIPTLAGVQLDGRIEQEWRKICQSK